jgi:hypothetical protein
MVKHEISDKIKSKLVEASEETSTKKETEKRIQNTAFLQKQTAKAERAQKSERESIEAAPVVKQKEFKDKKEWDASLLVEERLLKQEAKEENKREEAPPPPSFMAQQTKEVRMMMMIR